MSRTETPETDYKLRKRRITTIILILFALPLLTIGGYLAMAKGYTLQAIGAGMLGPAACFSLMARRFFAAYVSSGNSTALTDGVLSSLGIVYALSGFYILTFL